MVVYTPDAVAELGEGPDVALAEALVVILINDDDQILQVAASIGSPLASVR